MCRLPRDVVREELHHVLLGVGGLGRRGACAVGGDVEGFVVVKELEDVGGWRGVHDRGGDELVHGLVVRRVRGVVHETGAAGVDGSREEGETDGALFGDALEGADEVGAFKVLRKLLVKKDASWGIWGGSSDYC